MTIDAPDTVRRAGGAITHGCPCSAGFLVIHVTRGS